jgi:mannose/fructose/N-acetylgalactosamine-specific phosphotransferase system component IIC
MMVVEAFLIGLVAVFGCMDDFLGLSMFQRPIVLGPLVGLALGDLQSGVIIGANLELIWMGLMSVGSALPPDMITGGILGTAFAIISGEGVGVALALAVPIAMLAQALKTLIFMIRAGLVNKADKYAEQGDIAGVERMHYISFLLLIISFFTVAFLAVLLGSSVMEAFLKSVPQVIIDGLNAACGLLPAVGFAMLTSQMISKKLAPFFFLGFVLASYLKLGVIPIAILGTIIMLVIHTRTPKTN